MAFARFDRTPTADRRPVNQIAPARVKLSDHGWTFVMSVHPKCSCTRATIHELQQIMARCAGQLVGTVLVVRPAGAPPNWEAGGIVDALSHIPGVTTKIDEDGADALALGLSTSGQVVLYDQARVMRFTGGITPTRGHEGANIGEDSIINLVIGHTPPATSTPAFGCRLFALTETQ